ncbi:MAG TPA: hypothetical protein VJA94_16215 [Candidatus Angelobacter sp.]
MNYFVSAPTETNWKMTPEEFLGHLTARWPHATVRKLPSPLSYEWEIQMQGGPLGGDFYGRYPGVAFEGAFEDCAAFAVWFRSLVPAQQPLLFYDESLSVKMELKPETTVADIDAAVE